MKVPKNLTNIGGERDSSLEPPSSSKEVLKSPEFKIIEKGLDYYIENGDIGTAHCMVRYKWAVKVIEDFQPINTILDVACGSGYGSSLVARSFPSTRVIGADYDPNAIKHAERTCSIPNLEYKVGDVTLWEETIGSTVFDCILSFDTIEHVLHREIMMENIARHLDGKGHLLLSTPNAQPTLVLQSEWKHHKIEYTAARLYDFLKRYFAIVLRAETPGFPHLEVFDCLKGTEMDYILRLNPVICQAPIIVENPYLARKPSTDKSTDKKREWGNIENRYLPIEMIALDMILKEQKEQSLSKLYDILNSDSYEDILRYFNESVWYTFPFNWATLDNLHRLTRQALWKHDFWWYGPNKVLEYISVYKPHLKFANFLEAVVVDFGCGTWSPLGASAVFYLNGARSAFAIDVEPCGDTALAADALCELLLECIADPEEWHFSSIGRKDFIRRILSFDLKKLRDGDLHGGIANTGLRHMVGDIREVLTEGEGVDIIVSNTVLEHIEELKEISVFFHKILSGTGTMIHNVDFTDHRVYSDSSKNKWSFMTIDGGDSIGINKLRYSDIEKIFADAGFKVVDSHKVIEMPDEEVRKKFRPEYSNLSDEDISTTFALMCIQKSIS